MSKNYRRLAPASPPKPPSPVVPASSPAGLAFRLTPPLSLPRSRPPPRLRSRLAPLSPQPSSSRDVLPERRSLRPRPLPKMKRLKYSKQEKKPKKTIPPTIPRNNPPPPAYHCCVTLKNMTPQPASPPLPTPPPRNYPSSLVRNYRTSTRIIDF